MGLFKKICRAVDPGHYQRKAEREAAAAAAAAAEAERIRLILVAAEAERQRLVAESIKQAAEMERIQIEIEKKQAEAEALQRKKEEEEEITQQNMGMMNERHYREAERLYASLSLRNDIPPNTIGFIGNSGVGKSNLINRLSKNDNLVMVGRNQTTLALRVHHHAGNNYIDIPGMTAYLSYLTTEYMSVFKSVAWIGLVVEHNIDEVCLLAKLFDRVGKRYVIIVNKMDTEPNGIDQFKANTINRIGEHALTINPLTDLFFVSAKNPATPDTDWGRLTQRLNIDIPSYQY